MNDRKRLRMRLALAGSLALMSAFVGGCAIVQDVVAGYHKTATISLTEAVGNRGAELKVDPAVLVFRSYPDASPIRLVWTLSGASGLRFEGREGFRLDGEVKEPTVIETLGPTATAPTSKAVRPDGNNLPVVNKTITVDPNQDQIVNCTVSDDGLQATCLNLRTRPGRYKFTLQLIDQKKRYQLDPEIINW